MPEKFITRPHKYENESIEGYVFRLSIINHTSLKHTNIKTIRANSSEKEIAEYFENILILTGHKYNTNQFIHDWFKDDLTLPKWKMSKSTRFCPHCLIDSLYHRFFWSIALCTYCYKHQCYLNDKCDSCGKKVDIEETVLGTCKQCNTEFSENKKHSSEFKDEMVVGRSNVSSYFDPFITKREYLDLIKILSFHLNKKFLNNNIIESEMYYFRYWGYLNEVKLQYEINYLAIMLLEDWPYNIINYLHNNQRINAYQVKRFLIYFISKVKQPHLRIKLREEIHRGFGDDDSMTEEKIKQRREFSNPIRELH